MFYQKSIYWSTLGRYYSGKKKSILFVCKITMLPWPLFSKRTEKCPYTPKFSFKPFIYVSKDRYNCAKNLMEDFGQINNSLMANFWKKYGQKRPLEKCDFSKISKKITTHPLESFGTFFCPLTTILRRNFVFFSLFTSEMFP